MNILGISAFYHDSAAALVQNGEILAAAQEERFTRKKHDESFPIHAIKYCLEFADISIRDIDYVAFYEKPFLKFERLLETYLTFAPYGIGSFIKAMPVWIKQKIWIKELIAQKLSYSGKIIFPKHHESHAASAFFPSPFTDAAILTVDGVGEWTTTSYGIGKNNKLRLLSEIKFPHSLGLLYSAFTYYTGFKVNSGEYKVMGLAPYGIPRFAKKILQELVDVKTDGSFHLNLNYFNYAAGLTMTNQAFNQLFGGPPRKPETALTQKEMDLAASIQLVTEEILVRICKHIRKLTGAKNLCLAGGVALNCVANKQILDKCGFTDIWIQPAAGDAGGALGAALFTWYQYLGNKRIAQKKDAQNGSYLGPQFSNSEIYQFLKNKLIVNRRLTDSEIPHIIADLLAQEKVIGWFEGRMEFGPRALGARSILGDPRSPRMQSTMNIKIKFRESFRPFAPSILAERTSDYFELKKPSPYMLLIAKLNYKRRKRMTLKQMQLFGIQKLNVSRSEIPAVTHVDYSARIQTVHKDTNRLYYDLLNYFDKKYHCPILINTSFNVRGEPIVCTPEDAYRCFMRTGMDYLLLGNFLLDKTKQPVLTNDVRWQEEFQLD